MVVFPTNAKSTQQRFVSILEKLYAGEPVGSEAIGAALPMEHRQVLKYLHAAHADGAPPRAQPSSNKLARDGIVETVETRRLDDFELLSVPPKWKGTLFELRRCIA